VDGIAGRVADALTAVQDDLREEARALRDARTVDVATIEEARDAAQTGFARVPWSVLGVEGEQELAKGGVSVRCLQREDGGLAFSSAEPGLSALVARAY
jgi:prolyl-tRNA synthetase